MRIGAGHAQTIDLPGIDDSGFDRLFETAQVWTRAKQTRPMRFGVRL
jgi:hypothetical protein